MNTPFNRLAGGSFATTVDRLLLPIDLARCPFEVFAFVNRLARPFGGEITLLYVLDRRSNADQATFGNACRLQAHRHLERIGRELLGSTVEIHSRVRIGIPNEEISAEAAARRAELILLPVFIPSMWQRLLGSSRGETARNLVASAPCGLFVADVRTRFNCLRHWAGEESSSQWAA
jgi:hypothetical protein